jgi:hypothetical protein
MIIAYLNRIQHFQHPGMSQGSELAHRILGQRKSGLVRDDVESKHTAVGAIVLIICEKLASVTTRKCGNWSNFN